MLYTTDKQFIAHVIDAFVITAAMDTLGTRIKKRRADLGLDQVELAKRAGISQPTLANLESGKNKRTKFLPELARALRSTAEWLDTGKGVRDLDDDSGIASPGGNVINEELTEYHTHPRRRTADFELVSADQTDGEVGTIQYWDAKGSCGGGFLNYEQLPKGHLIKEATFFHRYGVKPENLFAIYADGNSMADFIVDGDIVIFDKTKTMPASGKIYLIEHPEGLRIKLLRRGIDGSWVLESKNPDKRTYPDERIEPGQEELLKIHGQFVYRQGG